MAARALPPAPAPPPAAATRERVLTEAARLFALRGYHGTSTDDLGAACGVTGPAVYKHFASKDDILAELLVGISQKLLDGGRRVVDEAMSPSAAVAALIEFHADFATSEPDLIRVQDRDLANLSPDQAHRVRLLQRTYAEIWVTALCAVRSDLTPELARIEAHAVFGLLNSTPHSGVGPVSRERLALMARKALGPRLD